MRNRLLYLIITISWALSSSLTTLAVEGVAEKRQPVSVGLVVGRSFEFHKSPLAALLEAKLSQREDIRLLERTEIDKILQEQKLSLAGLLKRNTAVRVGRLIRADALLLLSIENDQGNDISEKALLRIRLVETAHGLRLLDSFEQLDTTKPLETAERIAKRVFAVVGKLLVPPDAAIPVGIVDIHRVQLGGRYIWLERAIPAMLSARLSREPQIMMLEREDLKILHNEKLLTEGEDTEFWSSAVLIDGYLQRKGTKDVEMKLRLKRPAGQEIATLIASVEPNKPAIAIDKVATSVIEKLLESPPTGSWQPKEEAEEFFRQGQLLYKHQRYEDALAPLESARALQPDNMRCTWLLFESNWAARSVNEYRARAWKGRSWTPIPSYSDLELAEIVACLVRQIRAEHEKGSVSARDVLNRLGEPLGLDTHGYFAHPVSVATEEVRDINRESRAIWASIIHKALEERPDSYKAVHLAWVSSDVPEEVIANIREASAELLMPPEKGGRIQPADQRYWFCRAVLMDLPRNPHATQMKGAAERFQNLWRQYLQELTEMDDPLVKFVSSLALTQDYVSYKSKDEKKHYCYRALEVLRKELKTPDEPFSDHIKQSIRDEVKYTANDAEIDMNEQVSIWEGIYEPLIENEDVHNLVLWDPGRQCMLYDHRAPEANSHYFQLLERIATVLETRKGDREVAKALSDVRDCQAKIRRLFPELDLPQKPPDVPVTMLLTKSDWPEKRAIGGHLILPRLEENMLWLAFMGPPYNWQASVGLAGIDLKEKRLCALWQTKISFTRYPGVSGMVITKEACYLSVRGAGLLLLPGSAAEGREHFSNPKVLTQEHGLPSVLVTSLTKDGNRLWIAYGDRGQESGLGLYDPHTGYWETVLCSTLDGEPPFNAGQPYVLRKLTPVPPDRLFFLVCDPEYSRPTKMRQWTGVWRMNTNTQELKYLGVGSVEGPAPQGVLIADLGGKWLFGGRDSLTEFDLASERTRLVSAEEYLGVRNPKIGMGTSYAGETWARLGDSQIIIVQQGKSLEEATIIENNILDGGKVFEFLSTPYGLIAIGDGTVGLIETESDEK